MPLIVVPCLRPAPPRNGKILGEPYRVLWNVGDSLKYDCDLLHVIVGASEVFCSPDGSFTDHQPICGKLVCTNLFQTLYF